MDRARFSNAALVAAAALAFVACGKNTDDGPGASAAGNAGASAGGAGTGRGGRAGASAGGSAGVDATGSAGETGDEGGAGGVGDSGGSGGSGGSGDSGGTGGSGATGGGPCGCSTGDLQCNISCAPEGDCLTDKVCNGGQCVGLSPDGYRVCTAGPVEATSCPVADPSPFPNECCESSECSEGICVTGPGPEFCGGPAVDPYNYCASDECQSSADCDALEYGVCFPAGAYGFPVATCRGGYCRLNTDCREEADGRCLLVVDGCCGTPTLACVYPDGCSSLADCPDGSQSCRIESGRGVCSPEPEICPP